ncbi:ATP-binding protein [Alicyclobacillus sp. SO9]|nr:ATP-binding protein [Alicyclobacillus sp. SO9]
MKYYICIPLDRQDPRIDNEKWFMDKWNKHVQTWTEHAAAQGRHIEFEFWGSSELLSRLSQEKHVGTRFFWFAAEDFSEGWFRDRLDVSIDSLGKRYTPKLNFELDLSRTFDGITREQTFCEQFEHLYRQVQKDIKSIVNGVREDTLRSAAEAISDASKTLREAFDGIVLSEMNDVPLTKMANICLKMSDSVGICVEYYYKNRGKEGKANQDNKGNMHSLESNQFNSELYSLRQLEVALTELYDFLTGPSSLLANTPIMILKGEAGIGKSHMLADVAKHKAELGIPTILLLGQHFTNDDNPWTQILNNQLRVDMNEEEFLGAINAKAQSIGSRALIMIDAINEGRGRFFWTEHIRGFIRTVRKYKWIGLVISVRTSYETLLLPSDIITNDVAIRVTHYGFAEVEYEASKLFFDSYNIQQPSVPLLHPEFQNPLFLKIFCEGLYNSGLTVIPEGLEGISQILDFYVNSINERLSTASKLDYPSNINLVRSAVMSLIARKMESKLGYVPYKDANKLVCDETRDYTSDWRRFLDELINEGVITENLFYNGQEYVTGVYFAYERFDDHISVSYLLQHYLIKDNPGLSFQEGQELHGYVKDERSCEINKGLIEALTIQLPEAIGMELYEVAPYCKSFYPVVEAFVGSLIWRKVDTISEKVLPYVNKEVLRRKGTFDKFWDSIILTATSPRNFFNADRVHSMLMKQSLSERDAWWTPYISTHFSESTGVKRVIDWSWTTEDRTYISDESVRLSAIIISWFLTSPNRPLRDAATKALVCLLQDRIGVLIDVLVAFEAVNDPYVYERLYGAAYGCALRATSKEDIYILCKYVYKTIFAKEQTYPHILLRDYARGIVEFSFHLGMEDGAVDIAKARPPYRSEWYEYVPTLADIDHYKFDYNSEGFKKKYWGQNNVLRSMMTEYGTGMYGDFGRYVFQSVVSSWENHFDPQALSNIATKRVFELGYNVELHGEYDTEYTQNDNRHEHTNERIGKKYQWIAFHELLARLSDNYTMGEIDYDSRRAGTGKRTYKEIAFNGPWNPFVRDIDPTMLIRKNGNSRNFYNGMYRLPEENLDLWVHDYRSIPPLEDITLIRKSEKEFVLLSSYISWQERRDEDDYKDKKELFVKATGLLVPEGKVDYYARSKAVHNYSYRNYWAEEYNAFSREYFWHPVFVDRKLDVELDEETERELKETTMEYLWGTGYDKSIDGSIRYLIPSEFVVNQLSLRQTREGYWVNSDGEVICFDNALEGYNTGLFIERTSLEEMLHQTGLALIWDIFVEKVANRELHQWRTVARLQDEGVDVIWKYDEDNWPLQF